MISSDSITEIDGSEHGMVVERNSRLELTCRVTSGDRTPAFIIWQKENKVSSSQSLPASTSLQPGPLSWALFLVEILMLRRQLSYAIKSQVY